MACKTSDILFVLCTTVRLKYNVERSLIVPERRNLCCGNVERWSVGLEDESKVFF